MERQSVESSNLGSVGYDKKTQTLEVQFKNNGRVYQYKDVPSKVVKQLLEAESIGSYFRKNIAYRYKYKEMKQQ